MDAWQGLGTKQNHGYCILIIISYFVHTQSDLFGSSSIKSTTSGLENKGDMETVLAKHQEMQEKIAEDMIEIARSLKHRSEAARDIIKSDKDVCT